MKVANTILLAAAMLVVSVGAVAHAAKPSDLFIIRATHKTPVQVVGAVKRYVKMHHWVFIGANKVRMGTVTLVKVCIPKIGKRVWAQGFYLSAMLPCGNLGVYAHGGKTEVSMLNPRYMHVLVPTPAMAKISAMAEPMMLGMLDAVVK